MEASLPRGADRWPAGALSRQHADRSDAEAGSSDCDWTRKPPTDGATHWSTRSLAERPEAVVTRWSSGSGSERGCSRIVSSGTCGRRTRRSRPRRRTSSACISIRLSTPPSSVSTRRPRFRRSIDSIRSCPCRPVARNDTALSITATGPCPSTRRSIRAPARSSVRRRRDTPVRTSCVPRDGRATQPRRREIHIILDNLAAHKTKQVQAFLAAHPAVRLHFTPTYSSWLNQVELWFAKIERDVLARGMFTSVADLRRKILRYIRRYNRQQSLCGGPMRTRHAASRSCSTSVVYGPLVAQCLRVSDENSRKPILRAYRHLFVEPPMVSLGEQQIRGESSGDVDRDCWTRTKS